MVNEKVSLPDQVAGILNPIVYALNKGKKIEPQSIEHKMLFELLAKVNGSDAILDRVKFNGRKS